MIVTDFNPAAVTPLKTELAKVPQFGDDAEMVVSELSGKCRAYRDRLAKHVRELDGLSEDEKSNLGLFVMLVPCIVHPDTRDPLITIDQFVEFAGICSEETTNSLLEAYAKVNPKVVEEVIDETKTTKMREKKSKS
jgi:hypothetical protein